MTRNRFAHRNRVRWPMALCTWAVLAGMPFALSACSRTESQSKTTTTKTTETPEGTKKTTETTEKKVETTPK